MDSEKPIDTVPPVTPEEETPVEPVFNADPSKHAFAVLVMMGDAYVPGALVLAHSLKKAGSTASRVVLVSSDVSAEAKAQLAKVFDKIVVVPVIDVKVPFRQQADKKGEAKQAWIGKAFTKLNALKLTEFEKVCLLDADLICASSPDAIFKITAPAAVCTSLLRPADAAQHGVVIPSKAFDAANKDQGLRGCTYLLRPSEREFERAIRALAIKPVKAAPVVQKNNRVNKAKTQSAFSLLGDDSDSDEELTIAEQARIAAAAKKAEEEAAEAARALAAAPTEADDEGFINPSMVTHIVTEAPYDVFASSELAPLGLQYETRRGSMGADEVFFGDFYRNAWRHIHPRFGHPSWRKAEPGPSGSSLMHYAGDLPWVTRAQDWPDYAAWDLAALSLCEEDAALKTWLFAAVPVLEDKEKNGVTQEAPAAAPATPAAEASPEAAAPVAAAAATTEGAKDADVTPVPIGKAAAAAAAAAEKPAGGKSGLDASAKAWAPAPAPTAAAGGWAAVAAGKQTAKK